MSTTPKTLSAADAAKADAYFGPGDKFAPHDGKTTDLNVDGGWLLTEPNEALDPSRSGPTTTNPQEGT